tara:strand:+ start:101 stop:259 length:159 start_codon:yes stop_codon:yes gene_type:complete
MSDHDMFRLRQEMETMRSKIQQLVAEIHSLRVEMGYLRDSIPTTKTQTGGIV